MLNKIMMPALSPTMTSGVLSRWTVSIGDAIKKGDIVAEIETDKVTVELEAEQDGFIYQLLVNNGQENIAVGSVIAEISAEPIDVICKENVNINRESPSNNSDIDKSSSIGNKMQQQLQSEIHVSPLVRRMAAQSDVSLETITGSGHKGRITKEDLLKALDKPAVNDEDFSNRVMVEKVELPFHALPPYQEIPVSGTRRVIADRLTQSSRDVPHFYMSLDCVLDELLSLRKSVNANRDKEATISVNDLIVKATAIALQRIPEANVMWAEDKILSFEQVDIAIAVAVDSGLITPVIKACDQKGLNKISQESKFLVSKAKSGHLTTEDYVGGTFTISNLGMFGIEQFTSIINPPQCGILSVGAANKRPLIIGDNIHVRTMMTLTLGMDHRCVDGVVGARLLQTLKTILETPYEFIL